MNIILIGYGRMGKEIEKIALDRGHQIEEKIDISNPDDLNQELATRADVAIEFTTPESVVSNINKCFDLNLPVVTGTTGWHENLSEVSARCRGENKSLFVGSNFSVGVNLFFALNENLAELMDGFPQYNVTMEEVHHTKKLDTPSGTAVTLAELIITKLKRKNKWTLDNPSAADIGIVAKREGDVKGIHSVKYESEIDFIELTHHAKSRKGFAEGAVLAAEYLLNKKGIFTMRDLLGI